MVSPVTLKSQHHGSSYPAAPKQILKEFANLLEAVPTPKTPAPQTEAGQVLIVPHIDFRVNLTIYAQIYKHLILHKTFPQLFVILGVGHRCPAEFSSVPMDFSTPLGLAPCALDCWRQLEASSPLTVANFPETYNGEHSLEYVVIWLQALRDLFFQGQDFTVLPVLLGGLHQNISQAQIPAEDEAFHIFSANLRDCVINNGIDTDEICWIASIDGCHVGPRFDHNFYALDPVQSAVKGWEKRLWKLCSTSHLQTFFDHASSIDNMFYFDGIGVLTLLLQQFKLKAKPLFYDLWYEKHDCSFVSFTGGFMENDNLSQHR
ncbi:MAG: AmmeMemoRadiSam system protein B [Verrucomicrobiota bacterium]